MEIDTEKVTRFEVIDHSEDMADAIAYGRVLVRYNKRITPALQDDGRTLKVFITDREE